MHLLIDVLKKDNSIKLNDINAFRKWLNNNDYTTDGVQYDILYHIMVQYQQH